MKAETISIDGVEYRVFVEYPTRQRSFNIPDGPLAGKSLKPRKIRDIDGTYYSWSMIVGQDPKHPEDYDAFYEVISAPVDFHRVKMPFGQRELEFDAAIYSGTDVDEGVRGERRSWGDLQVFFEPMEPQRKPGDNAWKSALL